MHFRKAVSIRIQMPQLVFGWGICLADCTRSAQPYTRGMLFPQPFFADLSQRKILRTIRISGYSERKKPQPFDWGSCLFDAWQFPTLAWGDPTLPSALRRFTSEFGMGSGGTTALKPPGKFCMSCCTQTAKLKSVNSLKISQICQNTFGVVRLSLTGH